MTAVPDATAARIEAALEGIRQDQKDANREHRLEQKASSKAVWLLQGQLAAQWLLLAALMAKVFG